MSLLPLMHALLEFPRKVLNEGVGKATTYSVHVMETNSPEINMDLPRSHCGLRRNDQGGAISNLGTPVFWVGPCGEEGGRRRNGHQTPRVWENRNLVTSQ
jgi:hypothetical protein